VEKNEYSVMPSLVLYQSPAPMTFIEILMLALVVPGHAHRGWEQICHFRTIVTLSSLPVNLKGTS
jgi:hypothetical protein